MFGCVCFFEQLLTFWGLWRRRTSWVLHKNSFGYPKKTIEKKILHVSKNTADLIIKVRNVSKIKCTPSDGALVTHDHTLDFEASKAKNSSKPLFSFQPASNMYLSWTAMSFEQRAPVCFLFVLWLSRGSSIRGCLPSYTAIPTIFTLAESHLTLPLGLKCL